MLDSVQEEVTLYAGPPHRLRRVLIRISHTDGHRPGTGTADHHSTRRPLLYGLVWAEGKVECARRIPTSSRLVSPVDLISFRPEQTYPFQVDDTSGPLVVPGASFAYR